MIKNKDRSGWFGASDTKFIMGNWETKTFALWWLTKLKLNQNNFQNKYTIAGNFLEHRIANAIQQRIGLQLKKDRQIKIRALRLRVNLDAEDFKTIHEIKTTNKPITTIPKAYWEQVQVQMFVTNKKAKIWFYLLEEEDYNNFFREIDQNKLFEFDIEYNQEFIKEYKKRLNYLKLCLKRKEMPKQFKGE